MEFYQYTLEVATPLNQRSSRRALTGLLIREGNGVGCVQPWPELGDAPMEEQLQALRSGKDTPLIRAARTCAALDSSWRQQGVSAFQGRIIPESHATLVEPCLERVNEAKALGFQSVKVKGTPSLLAKLLEESSLPLRLDFNETLGAEGVREFLASLPDSARRCIDFIEDPCPYDSDKWCQLHQATGCQLALDRQASRAKEGGFQILVVKPAIDDLATMSNLIFQQALPFVVTSYMDHPIGQLYAAYQASVLAERFPQQFLTCGLATHGLFEGLTFAECLGSGPRLASPGGTGLGFDTYLQKLPWQTI